GIGYRWNPEFTMLEFYCAYMDVNGMMDFCEAMLRTTIQRTIGQTQVPYGITRSGSGLSFYEEKYVLDFTRPFERLTMRQAISKNWKPLYGDIRKWVVDEKWLSEARNIRLLATFQRMWEDFGNRSFHLRAETDVPSDA